MEGTLRVMKPMKAKSLLVAILVSLLVMGAPVQANTDIEDLVPNDYQNNKFRKNTDLIHERNLYNNERSNIPEVQKGLTFDGTGSETSEERLEALFQGTEKDTNTIKAKADNLKLFSETETAKLGSLEEQGENSSSLSLLIIIFAGICIVLLIVVMIAWARTGQNVKKA
ncbi:type VII secretion protein EssA [Rossellomorea marisflavi]|uniref:Type VII secretion protein EssA n=3 Tax=Rossellomorea marisflavi TaxID=189381 RepID=A0A5D4RIY4_9BACI|nr:type VII secretion protein EssA [Rossellomorea marisflavi]